jgi:PAS domain S-box-containing protein
MVDLSRLKNLTDELESKYEKFKKEYDILEGKYKIIVDNLNEGIWQLDKDNLTIYVNQRLASMFGYTIDEMIGKSLYNFIPNQYLDSAKNYVQRRIEGISEVHEFIFSRKDGSHIICLLSTSPIFINGNYAGAIAGVSDITERKEIEFICKAMADASFDPMIVHRNGIIIDVNDTLLKQSGYTREELLGKNSYQIGFPKESEDIARKHVEEKSTEPYVIKLKHKDGSLHNYEIHGRTLKFNGYSNLRVVVFREVL